ncbi:fibrinogen alpha chain isoform X1 [Scyliorhinus canicula]|uniref:fibrinogen alpha chain isoform X1 n=2 Tax=Scyliorhinus canicula TaxID=7830 RepID=UPI0018F3DB5D|nr:fibrinogen alpha chain isoform X1 [Scyliorhinus canicula]
MRAGQAFELFVCFMLVDWIQSKSILAPHGPRPVESGDWSRLKQCSEKEWSICAEDDWGRKCPSGCRVQELVETESRQNKDSIKEIRRKLETYFTAFENTHLIVTEAINRIKLTLNAMERFGATYYQLVDDLNTRLNILQNKTNDQSFKLSLLQNNILEQFKVIARLEVDTDIIIQSCKGSCNKTIVYNINKESNAQMEKSFQSLTDIRLDSIVYKKPINILKMSLVKNSDEVTDTKSVSDIDHEYPKFWEEVHTQLITRENDALHVNSHLVPDYYEGSFLTPTPMTSNTVSTDKGVDTQIVSMKLGAVSFTPDGIDSTGRDDVAFIPGVNSVRKAETSLMRARVDSRTEEPHFTTDSVKATSAYSSHSTKIYHSTTGSKTVRKQLFAKDSDKQVSNQNIFPDALFHNSEQIDFKEISLLQASKGSSVNSTHTEADSFGDFTNDSHFGHFGDSVTIDNRKYDFPSTKEVTISKSKTSHTESFHVSSGRQFTNAEGSEGIPEISHTTQPTLDPNLFFNESIAEELLDVQARSFNTDKVQKIKDYIGKDCDDIIQKHALGDEDGLFKIKPAGSANVVTVYCDQRTRLGGWVLVQQRMGGSVQFNRSWDEYKRGFGSIDDQGRGDVWLGNDILHLLTQKESVLRVELEDWSGNEVFAEYAVTVGSESESYVLNIANYVGNAGDALITGLSLDREHTSHVNMKFSTYDRDNDKWEENCAQFYGGGWWYNSCLSANLNGIYYHGGLYDPRNNMPYEVENGVIWVPFKGIDYSLKVVKVKIRPIASV